MARKKKPAGSAAAPTRRSKRATDRSGNPQEDQQSSSADTKPPELSSIVNPDLPASTSQSSSDSNTPQTTTDTPQPADPNPVQVAVALHKKFGKYRLLLNDESNSKRSEVSGSDSETGSVEIRVVDPTVSSESDSNVQPVDDQSDDTNARFTHSPSISNVVSLSPATSNVVSLSPATSNVVSLSPAASNVATLDSNLSSPAVSVRGRDDEMLNLDNDASLDAHNDYSRRVDVDLSNENSQVTVTPQAHDEPISSPQESQHAVDNSFPDLNEDHNSLLDDEVITVVQIVEDDSNEVYYDINMESSLDNSHFNQSHFSSDAAEDVNSDNIKKFQENFRQLNISNEPNSSMETSLDGTDVNMSMSSNSCSINDLQTAFDKPPNGLVRPDQSVTPSSVSDESTSSRLLTECQQGNSNDSTESSPGELRRSSRIKTISSLKQKTKGYGLVKTPLKKALIAQTKMKLDELSLDSSPSVSTIDSTPNSPSFSVPTEMPVKVKSRWRKSSELEMIINSPVHSPLASPNMQSRLHPINETSDTDEKQIIEEKLSALESEKVINDRMSQFHHLEENEYLCERAVSKEAKKMVCDCFLTKEEVERGELGCGEDCLNRLLMIECNYRCPVGDRCTNRRFQKRENADLKVFYAEKKGCGLSAAFDIPIGEFLMEYVGEVLDSDQFYKRAQEYSDDNNLHHYFMSLKGDSVIDATLKGNISRFINHSCEPNAETQKWTVNGELRIGFFSKRDITKGEEITFDYQFQRFGKVAQRCYCGAQNCRGWIGAEPDSEDEEEDDDEEDEDVSTSKLESKDSSKDASTDEGSLLHDSAKIGKKQKKKREGRKKYSIRPSTELAQDADIEDDLEALSRTGIKNQSHTLTLSRMTVRAKTRKSQTALLRLLREADLPCRRLFLDYRGLRLLAPWCSNTTLDFRLEMLRTLDRLPVPNKTMVQESRLFTFVERWLAEASTPVETDSTPVLIDEATGLPVELPAQKHLEMSAESQQETLVTRQKIIDISQQLLERWSNLKEVFKIPKKERIQQMKEHERQANVERRAADSSGGDRHAKRDSREERDRDRDRDRERDRDRDRERDRDKDRYRERDRDRQRERDKERERERDKEREREDRERRKRRSSPDNRRSLRSERVLAAIPPVSKEERRRAFAEAAAAAEQNRQQPAAPVNNVSWPQFPQWPPDSYPQMFPPGMMGAPPGMMPSAMMPPGMMPPGMMAPPAMMGVMPPAEVPPEWVGPNGEYVGPPPGFGPMGYAGAPQFCMPQHNYMGLPGYPMGYMFNAGSAAPVPGAPALPPPGPFTQPPPAQRTDLPKSGEMDPRRIGLLPSMWRSAQDERGRKYYYHVKTRIPQWTPPTPPPPPSDDEESSEEEESPVQTLSKGKLVEGRRGICKVIKKDILPKGLIPEQALLSCKPRKRRPGLVSERPISPRSEQDKLAGKLQVKRYKETKEKLRRRKEKAQEKLRRKNVAALPVKIELGSSDEEEDDEEEAAEDIPEVVEVVTIPKRKVAADAEETSRKLKDAFRSHMARVMVHHLNPYRSRHATSARITNNADFKHLARKLTHFVMLKELKHCRSVEELECNESVKQKAKEFVRKYMSKFGAVYQRPAEEMD